MYLLQILWASFPASSNWGTTKWMVTKWKTLLFTIGRHNKNIFHTTIHSHHQTNSNHKSYRSWRNHSSIWEFLPTIFTYIHHKRPLTVGKYKPSTLNRNIPTDWLMVRNPVVGGWAKPKSPGAKLRDATFKVSLKDSGLTVEPVGLIRTWKEKWWHLDICFVIIYGISYQIIFYCIINSIYKYRYIYIKTHLLLIV